MHITRFSLEHKPVIFVLMAIMIILGWRSYTSLPREANPSITIPIILVSTSYFGVSPGDIETLITQPIEKKVKEITDLKEVRSTSSEGLSMIEVEFNPDIDIDEAIQKVRDKVDLAKPELPADADDPMISEIDLSTFPIMLVNISGDYGLVKLKEVAEHLEDRFENIPGVLDVTITGGLDREVKVNIDLSKLKYYRISFKDVIDAIRNENRTIPGGSVEVGKLNYLIRVPGEFEQPETIRDIIVKVIDGQAVYIKDLAEVVYGFKERDSYARQNGVECITLSVKKRSGENIIAVSDGVKQEIARMMPFLPEGTKIDLLADQSKQIRRMVNELENNIISGLLLVVAVLVLFLGFRNSLFIALSIPLSMLISFIFIQALGYTLNMIVLFSLILALGMLVDNAIVIIENVYRHQQEGYGMLMAAWLGTREVGAAVSASTLTTVCAFAPMLFWPGIMGEFMGYLPATLIITLGSCLFVALIFNPVIAAQFMKKRTREAGRFDRGLQRVIAVYEKSLLFALRRRGATIGLSFALLVLILLFYGIFGRGVEFMPDVDPYQLTIDVTAPSGTNIDESNRIVKKIEARLPQFLGDVKNYTASVGFTMATTSNEMGGGGTPHKSRITLEFIDREYREQSSVITMEQIREAVSDIAGARIEVNKPEMGPPTGAPISIELSGDDFKVLGSLAQKIRREIRDIPGLVDLRDTFDQGRPELRVIIDREKARLYGLNTAKIANTVRTAINGTEASEYRINDEEYDITVRLSKEWRNQISDLEQLIIFDEGKPVPLSSIASLEFGGGFSSIKRKDLKRVVTITGNTAGRLDNEVLADIRTRLDAFELPSGYSIDYTGQNKEQQDSMEFLSGAFLIALLLIFLVLVSEFNSVITPFIIMLSVLLSLAGVFLGLLVTGTPFGVIMTGIGVISLAGVVVNNAIVLLDYTMKLRERGLEKQTAIVQAGKTRFRPVILTAVTTILGLIPLTTGLNIDFFNLTFTYGGDSQQWWGPMGFAVIFGLAFATFLTLIVVPVAYSLLDDVSVYFQRLAGVKREKLESAGTDALPDPAKS